MNRYKAGLTMAVACGTVSAWTAVARAQVIVEGQRASDNVSGGAIAARSPGNMVSAGVARAQAAADFPRGGIEIVETTRPISPRAVFLVDAIETIFKQLNLTLLYLGDVLRQRAGLPPLIPEVTTPTTTGGNTNGGDTSGVNAGDLQDLSNP